MANQLNGPGNAYAHARISAGAVDKEASWSFAASDGNSLLGDGGDDWANYGRHHLGIDSTQASDTKAHYKYPFAKGSTVYRSALTAIRQRAGQQGDTDIFDAAGRLINQIDGKAISIEIDDLNLLEITDSDESKRTVEEFKNVTVDAEVKAVEGEDRTLSFVVSTGSVDRMGDTVSADGWQLDNYRKNPVVLWAHDSSLPIGRAENIEVQDGSLKATTQFMPAHNAHFGSLSEGLFQAYRDGFLKATSVGFRPIEFQFSKEPGREFGVDFLKQELLEFSLVAVPANPEALIEAKKAGIGVEPIVEWCMKQFGDEAVMEYSLKIAERRDLFARAWCERIVQACAIPILTADRQKQVEAYENFVKRQRVRQRRDRELEVLRLRASA